VAVEVALVDESGRERNLGDRDAALEHPAGGSDSTRELEAVRRMPYGRTEQASQPVPADTTRGTCELVERDVAGELVAQQLTLFAARDRGARPGGSFAARGDRPRRAATP
jgi:hypothetical protein